MSNGTNGSNGQGISWDPTGENGPVPVLGIPVQSGSGGALPLRREVRELQANSPELWTLYLLGLQRFQQVAEDSPISYFQIAGIHGLPYDKWPDRDWNQMPESQDPNGYKGLCTHSSILFLPWHRPYLSLFEAELFKHVGEVAQQFSDNGEPQYVELARSFRMPYWDWALPHNAGITIFPDAALGIKPLSVPKPGSGGKPVELDSNPLFAYTFQGSWPDIQVNNLPTTVRYPQFKAPKAQAQMVNTLEAFYNQTSAGKNLTERVAYILQSYAKYGPFSNNKYPAGKPEIYGSMEDIHNAIHNFTGSQGHMGQVPISSFDPIFWLHHTNIDRCFAIWQALHSAKNNYIMNEPSDWGTFSLDTQAIEGLQTDLTPFNDTETSYWKADDVRTTNEFGYAYPETQNWKFSDPATYAADIKQQLLKLYNTGSLSTLSSDAANGKPAPMKLVTSRAKSLLKVADTKADAQTHLGIALKSQQPESAPAAVPAPSLPSDRDITDLTRNNTYLEWLTNLKARKHSLRGAYAVHVFLGPVNEPNPLLWPASPYHVGAFVSLGQEPDTRCSKCRDAQDSNLQVTGQIPLTIALAERYIAGQIDGLTPDHVVPYLQENLHWRVALNDATEASRGDVDDLIVSVVSNKVDLPTQQGELPRYAPDVTIYPEITTKADGSTGRGEGTGLTDVGQA